MKAISAVLLVILALSSCSERHCSDPGVCWANRSDVVEAAERCGIDDFEPSEAAGTWLPYVEGEDPDTGPKTNCILDELDSQGLMVTH